jgi:hypothetical protein
MSVPKTMKALVAYSQTDYRFVPDFPVPECGPDKGQKQKKGYERFRYPYFLHGKKSIY